MNRLVLAAAVFASIAATAMGVKSIATPSGVSPSPNDLGSVEKADLVVVEKSDRTLVLYRNGRHLRAFPIALGSHSIGRKQRADDGKTPEGRYVLDRKDPASRHYKSIAISYPSAYDLEIARKQHRDIPTGAVVIHGQKPAFKYFSSLTRSLDWTDGSIALSNGDMDAVWAAVDAGTPIEIKP